MTVPAVTFTGYGHYRPRHKHTTAEMTDGCALSTSDVEDKVVGGIGVQTRNLAEPDETIVFMGIEAGRMALARAGADASEIGMLILASWTQRMWIPDLAPQIADGLGALNAFSFDISTACFGFIHSVVTARSFLLAEPNRYDKILVVASERFKDRVRPGSKGELIVADGAGAVVLQRAAAGHTGLLAYAEESQGALKDIIAVKRPEGWIRSESALPDEVSNSTARHVEHLLAAAGLDVNDLDWFVPHPGTEPVLKSLVERLSIPWEKVLVNFATTANISAASVPLLLSEMHERGTVKSGQLALITAVGSGFYSGGMLVRL